MYSGGYTYFIFLPISNRFSVNPQSSVARSLVFLYLFTSKSSASKTFCLTNWDLTMTLSNGTTIFVKDSQPLQFSMYYFFCHRSLDSCAYVFETFHLRIVAIFFLYFKASPTDQSIFPARTICPDDVRLIGRFFIYIGQRSRYRADIVNYSSVRQENSLLEFCSNHWKRPRDRGGKFN